MLLSADSVTGNATAAAYGQAITEVFNPYGQQVIAQAYSSATLSLYQANLRYTLLNKHFGSLAMLTFLHATL